MDIKKILIADRDRLNTQTMENILEQEGYLPTIELSKDDAVRRVTEEEFNIAIINPSPQPDVRPSIIALRRNAAAKGHYIYLAVASRDNILPESLSKGANSFIQIPVQQEQLTSLLDSGKRFMEFYTYLKEKQHDNQTLCIGPMMGCSSVVQVLLSSIDRADRYGERTYVLKTKISYLPELKEAMGEKIFQDFYNRFTQEVLRVRRQSDLFGRLEEGLFTLIMQRPLNEREPVDAAARMHKNLERFIHNATEFAQYPIRFTMQSLAIPTGEIVANLTVTNEAGKTL